MLLMILLGLAFFAGMGALTSLRVLREYERAIVFRLGRARPKALGPGMVVMLPFGIDRSTTVDTRTKVIQIPTQEVITRDNISIGVDAVVYIEISSPMDAILRVEQYLPATLQLAATTLRSIIGRMELDEVLAKRAEINTEVQEILESRVEQWGVNITAVEIKDISLPAEMKRAMARQAEAERERRAKIIMADGELQAAQRLADAARLMADDPAALQLRLYQTMVEVAAQPNMTIVLPVPIELLAGGRHAGSPTATVSGTAQAVARAAASLAGSANARQLSPSAPASAEPTESTDALKAALVEPPRDAVKAPLVEPPPPAAKRPR